MRNYAGLDKFLDHLANDVGQMCTSDFHDKFSERSWEVFKEHFAPLRGAKILDVGCGYGRDLKMFLADGLKAVGITLWDKDERLDDVREHIVLADQSFTEFPEEVFDFLWARHVLEHSPFPYFTLYEYNRVLKNGGVAYIELPAPSFPALHELNISHYSVLGEYMWEVLFRRAGFVVKMKQYADMNATFAEGERKDETILADRFYCYYLEKVEDAYSTPAVDIFNKTHADLLAKMQKDSQERAERVKV